MKDFNEQEFNKKCAEFLGIVTGRGYWIEFEKRLPNNITGYYSNRHHIDQLCFHSDWNWIMEVVEKIESLPVVYAITISGKTCWPHNVMTKDKPISIYKVCIDKREAVVQAIDQFLNWYNEEKI